MKLKGIKIVEYNANGLFVYGDSVEVNNGSLYGELYSIPKELTPLTEYGVYNADYEPIDMANYVDPLSWIPKNIRPEYEWLAMDENGEWWLFPCEPRAEGISWSPGNGEEIELSGIIDTKTDPLGWKNSKFRRIDGKWRRA